MPITAVGLRYFNVYGPREQHKGRMASVIHHFTKQTKERGRVRLFAGSGGDGDGEQQRDFVYIRDLTRLNMFFAQIGPYAPNAGEEGRHYRGVVNAGTGISRSFNDVARALMAVHGEAAIYSPPRSKKALSRPAQHCGRSENSAASHRKTAVAQAGR